MNKTIDLFEMVNGNDYVNESYCYQKAWQEFYRKKIKERELKEKQNEIEKEQM